MLRALALGGAVIAAFALAALGLAGAAWLLLLRDGALGGFRRLPAPPRAPETRAEGALETVFFPALDEARLEGWLLRPHGAPAPLVIMAPGLTGTKDGHLEPIAWRFVRAGFAVLLFDFRCFGGSEGEPRHWVDPFRQVDDYRAALAFARETLAQDGAIACGRIALWGSSFSAGTAIAAGAGRSDIAAVVAQCPFLATPPHLEPRGLALARFGFATLLDLARARLGFAPVYVPAFGQPGEFCFAPSRENPSRFDASQRGARFWQTLPDPPRGGWENKLLARFLADFDRFQPLASLPALSCPVYFAAARHDDLVPLALVERGRALAPPGSALDVHECAHFDLYLEPQLAENARRQAEFLRRAFAVRPNDSAARSAIPPAFVPSSA
jgi:pimeloyl-ACP methyl ester carboxylesterase